VQEGLSDWFLPIINFNMNSYNINYSEYEKLYQVAQVLKNNRKYASPLPATPTKPARSATTTCCRTTAPKLPSNSS
jgi:hypothetical protein